MENIEEVRKTIRCNMQKVEREGGFKSLSLSEADKTINGERQDIYGSPEDSFAVISDYWTVYMRHRRAGAIQREDVAVMMTLFKVARLQGQAWHRDNVIDAIGYLAILADRIHGGE